MLETAKEEDPEVFRLARRLNLVTYMILIAAIVLMFFIFRSNTEGAKDNLQVVPIQFHVISFLAPIVLVSLALAVSTTAFFFLRGFRSNPRNLLLSPLTIPKAKICTSVINIVAISLSIAIFLYLAGIVAAIFDFFQGVLFPSLSSLANMILANIVGWILAGVAGNFVYDLLKRIILEKSREK